MTRSRTVIVAGAGIGGLTTALALLRHGYRVVIFEQSERLEETGAGIQLSPNATRVLFGLGVGATLKTAAVGPQAICIRDGCSGRKLARLPLGDAAEFRYGAPFWVVHRGDLQAALTAAIEASPDAVLRLGAKVQDFAFHAHGVTVEFRRGSETLHEHGIALIGADGLWSTVRVRLGDRRPPRFAERTAWRALVPIDRITPESGKPLTTLWLGPNAHVVHYPVKGGEALNIVAVLEDHRPLSGWSTTGARDQLLAAVSDWHAGVRDLLAVPQSWLTWALFDRAPASRWSVGPVALLGDAAHPMLPFAAQGAAMAIEDAAVVSDCLAKDADPPATALRAYEGLRRHRTTRVWRLARRNGAIYHMAGPAALLRNLALRTIGGESLLARYEWLYDWRQA